MFQFRSVSTSAVIALLVACVSGGESEDRITYPEAMRSDRVDDYFGVAVADPYRWMEDMESDTVRNWIEAENRISFPYLAALPARESLLKRFRELWDYERYGLPTKKAARYFYWHNDGLQDQSVLYLTESLRGRPRVLIDPNKLREDATDSVGSVEISHDGTLIAYSISAGGSDWKKWRIRDVASGEDHPDLIRGTKFTGISWSLDDRGFYYSRYPIAGDGIADDQRQVAIYYHRIGDEQDEDVLVFEITDHDTRNPYGSVTDDGRYLVIQVSDKVDTNGVYYMPLDGPDRTVGRLFDAWDARYRVVDTDGDIFYVHTDKGAANWQLVAVDVNEPDEWQVLIPQQESVLRRVSRAGNRFFAQYLVDARSRVESYTRRGEHLGEVQLPGLGTASGFSGEREDEETFFSFSSYVSPPRVYRHSLTDDSTDLFKAADVAADTDAYETTQVFYASKDGTRVPMFVTHRKDIVLDGGNPTLLYGYGGFNISQTPRYNTSFMVWLEIGGIVAVANLRGGGEYGKTWHEAGTRENKQNVFDDFIAAAEWLIDNEYTSTAKLAVYGGSNGGLLVGASITQRPDLFGAAIPNVGVLDMLRYHTTSANARAWSSDYGLSENESDFRAQYAYSPLHNVHNGTCYPPTLITTGDRDNRVMPWHSFKFAAEMQQAQGCASPVLIRVETRAGHGAGKPTWMRIEQAADQWAFLATQLDFEVPDFE
ncbi:MAG: prolyl oligopeptidase family protein [Woeseia sp.]